LLSENEILRTGVSIVGFKLFKALFYGVIWLARAADLVD
jgi:hypothetical protein